MYQDGKRASMKLDCCWTQALLTLGILKDVKVAVCGTWLADPGWWEEAGTACRKQISQVDTPWKNNTAGNTRNSREKMLKHQEVSANVSWEGLCSRGAERAQTSLLLHTALELSLEQGQDFGGCCTAQSMEKVRLCLEDFSLP